MTILVVGPAFAQAAPVFHWTTVTIGAATLAQSSGASREQAAQLLSVARRALRAGDLHKANQAITKAEKLNVGYGLFHLGDTPQKARRDLQKAQQVVDSKRSKVRLPSSRFNPFSKTAEKTTTADPFLKSRSKQVVDTPDKVVKQTAADRLELPRSAKSNFNTDRGFAGKKSLATELPDGASDSALNGPPPVDVTASVSRPNSAASLVAPAQDDRPTRRPETRAFAERIELPDIVASQKLAKRDEAVQPASAVEHERTINLRRSPRQLAQHKATSPQQQAASKRSLLAARLALAVGDLRTARAHLQQSRSLQVQYGIKDDSPAKVAAAIQKYEDVAARRKARPQSKATGRMYAELLLQQAEILGRYGRLDEAERLARDAGKLPVSYGPFDTKPQMVLGRLAKLRATLPAGATQTLAAELPAKPLAETKKQQCLKLTLQARKALQAGDLDVAQQHVDAAMRLGVEDSQFAPGEDRPQLVALAIVKARTLNQVASAERQSQARQHATQPAVYDASRDETYNTPAQASVETEELDDLEIDIAEAREGGPPPVTVASPKAQTILNNTTTSMGQRLYEAGEKALRKQNRAEAVRLFRESYRHREELDPLVVQRLQDHLQLLAAPRQLDPQAASGGAKSLMDTTAAREQLLGRQLSAEISREQAETRKLREKRPQEALERLQTLKQRVAKAGLDPRREKQLTRRVQSSIAEMESYIDKNRAQIELDQQNRSVRSQIDRERKNKLETQQKLAKLNDEFNRYMDQHEYEKMEVIAKRARELAPDDPIARQMWLYARNLIRVVNDQQFRDEKEDAVFHALNNIEQSAKPFDDDNPINFGNVKEWESLTKRRRDRFGRDANSRRTEREIEIEQKLRHPVSVDFQEQPLGDVLNRMAALTGVNIHLDPRGLAEENVTSNTPVTISLKEEIMLKSALNLILEPLHLSYVIKDEVLKITSEQLRDGEVFTTTYNVADLVIPIPNFVPSSNMGLQGAINDAYAALGYGPNAGGAGFATMAGPNGTGGAAQINPQLMAQMSASTPGPRNAAGPMNVGPGGLGGGANADFDSLIELITATIQPNTWDEVGGPGSVREFATNLSLVVSQTQDVHDEIVDLLEQLRRLQDLQVTIEVRFIRLNDNFFERIGIDFDFNIEDKIGGGDFNGGTDFQRPSATVGITGPGASGELPSFTADLDLPFRQESFAIATPGFGTPVDVASFGFAILSDIEAFFLINAAQGDRRSNILQAPKVTLFNGQQAFVADSALTPFVISVVPVVGDFAAAQQPVIVVLSEGTFLTIQAVVSNDRRYVRLTVVPFFSQIGDVQEFQFEGTTSTSNSSSGGGVDDDDNPVPASEENSENRSGTTVQLPTFLFVTVTTTVSVPDGGTVLLGGIKRLSESRTEFGVPILSKVPYVNRLFRNVGIGRDAESLMMMVTPRIIIQEEEEERLGLSQ